MMYIEVHCEHDFVIKLYQWCDSEWYLSQRHGHNVTRIRFRNLTSALSQMEMLISDSEIAYCYVRDLMLEVHHNDGNQFRMISNRYQTDMVTIINHSTGVQAYEKINVALKRFHRDKMEGGWVEIFK